MFYLFHHIPKTGGKSCREALSKNFNIIKDYPPPNSKKMLAKYMRNSVDLDSLVASDVLCGHYNSSGNRLNERYPQLKDYEHRKISFLRRPLDAATSGVRFGVQRGRFNPDHAGRLILKRVGYFARILQCTEDNYQQRIDDFFFVGLTERLQESMDRLSDLTSMPRVEVPVINKTDPGIELEIEKRILDQFVEENRLDDRIYGYVCEKFAHH